MLKKLLQVTTLLAALGVIAYGAYFEAGPGRAHRILTAEDGSMWPPPN